MSSKFLDDSVLVSAYAQDLSQGSKEKWTDAKPHEVRC